LDQLITRVVLKLPAYFSVKILVENVVDRTAGSSHKEGTDAEESYQIQVRKHAGFCSKANAP
jgi:hypothetical protein